MTAAGSHNSASSTPATATAPAAVHAAIDIGTNSIHLVVARSDASGAFEVLATDKEAVRLGEGATAETGLTTEAMDRGIATLDRFRRVAESYGADAVAVATSAVREAANQAEFLDRANGEAGLQVEVIPGVEEARLIHLGVLQALPVYDQKILVVDIGGGSTELVVGRGVDMLIARSVRLGHIRLMDQFFPGGDVEDGAVDRCREYVRSYLAPIALAIEPFGHEVAIGSSGTVGAIASLLKNGGSPTDERPVIRADQLTELVDRLGACPTPEARLAQIPGLEEKRADVVVGGAILLEQIFGLLGIEEMTCSPFALREGVLLNRTLGARSGEGALRDIRRKSLLRFADAFQEDRDHVEHGTHLALCLFDELQSQHGFGAFERNILEAAGWLHNVGLFISHAAHHKHSYYVIKNSDRLTGYTNREIELIAQVSRYHRKSGPKSTHATWVGLPLLDRTRISVLSGILRVAIALDRSRSQAVSGLSATTSSGRVTIAIDVAGDADPSLELFTAQERSEPLSTALGLPVQVVART